MRVTSQDAPPAMEDALRRAEEGNGISRADALALLESAELGTLLQAAATVRDRAKAVQSAIQERSSFRLPIFAAIIAATARSELTRRRPPGLHDPGEVLAVAEAGRRAGCKEALFSLGDQPETSVPGSERVSEKAGLRSHARIPGGHERAGAGEDRTACRIPIRV